LSGLISKCVPQAKVLHLFAEMAQKSFVNLTAAHPAVRQRFIAVDWHGTMFGAAICDFDRRQTG
jgi:hypothetical protein